MHRVVTDDELEAAVREELAWDSRIDDSCIDVEVDNGVVTLAGTVSSYAEKLMAIEASQVFAGAHELISKLSIVPTEELEPTDAELADMVQKVLTWDALVPSHDLNIEVDDGVVTITGVVATDAQRSEVDRAIRGIVGIQTIENHISLATPSDVLDSVRSALRDALTRRALHQMNHIDFAIDGSEVTLRGRVQSAGEKRAVLGAVTHAPGIDVVHDELLIEPVEQFR